MFLRTKHQRRASKTALNLPVAKGLTSPSLDMSILLTSTLSGQPDQTNSVKTYLVSASQMARVMEAFGDQGKYQANLNARIFHQNFQRSRLDSEPGPKMLQNLD